MKNKIWFAPRLAFVLAILISVGCGMSSQVIPTPAEKVNTVPAATPTAAPTSTPIPTLDLSGARIGLDELPTGFAELPTDDFNLEQTTSGDGGLEPEAVFAFMNASQFQIIFGMNFLLLDTLDRLGFEFALGQPEIALKEFAGALGTQNIRDEKLLEGLDDVGEKQIAMTMVADVEGIPMRVDVALFHRDVVGGMIMSMTMEGKPENISLKELGKLFDEHIQDSLNASD